MSLSICGQNGELPETQIAIVVSRYNESITGKLSVAAEQTLLDAGFTPESITVAHVPGAWELPLITAHFLRQPKFGAVIALGAVIRGETTHDEHINRAVSLALMNLGLETGKPVAFGLLTCNTVEQAIHRSGGNVGNKGVESADAILEVLRLQPKLPA
ncbi:6,7-dimethyl-8-ribityllumazine synthase [Roseimaritima multifibrata]|uniref:6,7-dimethyl-8-ribityllumazine synthase n=1 Tax=Roseimaritima multifibrata TaxID=1930274 RepID=A0A517MFK9_9BACT|nr:6,7-dimethyl-8-ribityllumazine synthase [Roseimaritima multifibrata]QDS93673.1 6,7-dimethyl-8-ribityllumazine synthase [Roseimaritima multifibrata]